ncbi:MBL fold metallo-hydrolase [bacterium]|nr:MBL fold metallo-hydrolase [bacterium]MCK4326386.1 MBL fold metallo-hydrolase [bacterium]MCK4436732.1 MBL fold metallo-hydrolase [bacterium]
MRLSKFLILLLTALAVLIWGLVLHQPSHLLKVTFLDVGQGDSAFIQFPCGGNMLIDGGQGGRYDMGKKVLTPFLRRKGVRKIDTLLLTHPHADHVGGLATVLRNFKVGLVLESGQSHTTYSYEEFLRLVEERRINYRVVKAGERIEGYEEVEIQILNPPPTLLEGTRSDLNNNSVVLKIAYRKVSLLLSADIEREAENRLLRYGQLLKSTAVKVPHQGSRSSSTKPFLDLVDPEVAIISVGKHNPFGHPSPIVLKRYEEMGTKVYRTDRQGAVTFISDGRKFWIKTMK